jgi:hypothetical protein
VVRSQKERLFVAGTREKNTQEGKGNWAVAVLSDVQGIHVDVVLALKGTVGVKRVTADHISSMLTITFDPEVIEIAHLKKIIREGNNHGERPRKS